MLLPDPARRSPIPQTADPEHSRPHATRRKRAVLRFPVSGEAVGGPETRPIGPKSVDFPRPGRNLSVPELSTRPDSGVLRPTALRDCGRFGPDRAAPQSPSTCSRTCGKAPSEGGTGPCCCPAVAPVHVVQQTLGRISLANTSRCIHARSGQVYRVLPGRVGPLTEATDPGKWPGA